MARVWADAETSKNGDNGDESRVSLEQIVAFLCSSVPSIALSLSIDGRHNGKCYHCLNENTRCPNNYEKSIPIIQNSIISYNPVKNQEEIEEPSIIV
jgi:hypothetical protein